MLAMLTKFSVIRDKYGASHSPDCVKDTRKCGAIIKFCCDDKTPKKMSKRSLPLIVNAFANSVDCSKPQ